MSGADSPRPPSLFLCGDVMLGRGIDQALPHPGRPRLFEDYVRDARDYVALAEKAHGTLPRPLPFDYVWGEALGELERRAPALRLANLETSVTTSEAAWSGKGIHYRMHPDNLPCLAAAGIEVCALANNHVLDWGHDGLLETLARLRAAGIAPVGAGEDRDSAERPVIRPLPGAGRVIVFAFADASAGVPAEWEAGPGRPGVDLLPDLSAASAGRIGRRVAALKRPGDVVIAFIHWGSNWGYQIPAAQRDFAHALIERAGVDLVHGHSSHHPRPPEIHRGHLILYGCGDFLNDYEGIGGYEAFRADLTLMYFATLSPDDGRLLALAMVPLRIRRFRLQRASEAEAAWLAKTLDRAARRLGTRVSMTADRTLTAAR